MTIELITGHAGAAHISSEDAGQYNVGTVGAGKYVCDTGTQLACEVQSANLVTVGTGDAIFEGRHVRVSATENVAIDNGAQGVNRNDIICIEYEYDSGTGEEAASLVVIKGTATSGTPSDPTIPSGSILSGSSTAYMPLWRIPISGITVGTPVKLYGDVLVTLTGMLTKVWTASQIPNLAASKITSGTLGTARVPNLDASKITSGTFAVDRIPTLTAAKIPNLDASKITTGTLGTARIPSLDASKITSGTLSADRIPSISASKIASGTLSADRIPNLSAAKITSGTLASDRIPSLDASKIASGTLATARIPSLDASKITSGAFTSARIPSLDASKIGSGTLSADRIPGLAASKITSGVLGISRGGTGKSEGTAWLSVTLYNSTATTGTVTLSDSAANYTFMEIYFRDNDNHYSSTKVLGPNGKVVNLSMISNTVNGQCNYKRREVTINGTSITTQSYGEQDGGAAATSTNHIYIYAVIGYK